jgi:tetratricopeptide (TPR) repeat protein
MSPGRLKKNLKSKLTSSPPKRDRPPQPKIPLHPGSSDDGRSKNSFDDGLDQIALTLGRTTMSFDVDDNKSPEEDYVDEEESVDMNIDEPDIEDGCIINTTSFNIFERREFLRAMGGANEASSSKNYIQQGDALFEQGSEQLDRAVQMYYAGLGVVLSRIREWTIERQEEERDAPIASGENDVPPIPLTTPSNLSYGDFVRAANCPDVNVLLLVISSILFRSGNAHFRLHNFETACRDYSSAQSYQLIRTKALSNNGINESLVMEDAKLNGRVKNNMASALSKRQLYEEARVEYTKALQIKQSTLEALHKTTRQKGDSVKDIDDKNLVSDIASTFHNIGLLRLNCGDASKAEKAFKQSLSLRVKKFGLDDLRVSSTLNALGGLYYQTKRYDDAFRSYKESLRIWKLNGGKSDLQTAEHYYNIGLVFYAKGPYSKARVSVAECAKIRRIVCGNISLAVAEALYLLGKISLSSGNYEDAFDKFQEALAIRQKLLGKDHLLVSNVHLPMGKVHLEMEVYDKAMCSFSVALAIRSERLGKHHVSVAEVLHAIGSMYIAVEDYSKALETLQEALRLRRKFLGPSLEAAETLNSMSLVFFKSGDTERAIELGEESLVMLKSSVGFDHILVAHVLKNTGDYYQDIEAYDDAMDSYGESLRIMASWLGREHVLLSKTLSEVGVVRFKTGEYTIAKQSFTEASRFSPLLVLFPIRLVRGSANLRYFVFSIFLPGIENYATT